MGTAPNRFRGISKSQNLFLKCLKKWMTEAGIYSGSSVVISEKEGAKGNARCNGICTVHTILPTDIIRVDFPKLCEESVLEEGVLDEDTAD